MVKVDFGEETYFKGWIPTLSGRLSFDVAGEEFFPEPPCWMINEIDDDSHRLIGCHQVRNGLDPIDLPLVKHFPRLMRGFGRNHFFCLARTSNDTENLDDPLTGRVLLSTRLRGKSERMAMRGQ